MAPARRCVVPVTAEDISGACPADAGRVGAYRKRGNSSNSAASADRQTSRCWHGGCRGPVARATDRPHCDAHMSDFPPLRDSPDRSQIRRSRIIGALATVYMLTRKIGLGRPLRRPWTAAFRLSAWPSAQRARNPPSFAAARRVPMPRPRDGVRRDCDRASPADSGTPARSVRIGGLGAIVACHDRPCAHHRVS